MYPAFFFPPAVDPANVNVDALALPFSRAEWLTTGAEIFLP